MHTATAPRRHRYAAIDPLATIGPALDRLEPVDGCCCLCCRCNRTRGLYWALGLFVVEAINHITLSLLRPTWEWHSTMITIVAFYLQDALRAALLVLCVFGCKALRKGRDGVAEWRLLLRGLLVLAVLEMFEISLKAVEVHNVCDAPEVIAARARRNGTGSLSEQQCELISDLYDYLWGVMTLVVLGTVIRVVHSHIRAFGGATWQQQSQQQSQPQPRQDAGTPAAPVQQQQQVPVAPAAELEVSTVV